MSYSSSGGMVEALGPIDLDVRDGEFVSVVGPSGCGKSTALLLIAGLLQPAAGEVVIDNRVVRGPQTDVGIVFQAPVLVDWRSVQGNIALQLELRGLRVEDYRSRIRELLASVGLTDFAGSRPYELSGGMQQRAAICRALVHDPPLLLMDEPFGALDALTREQLRVDLEHLWLSSEKTFIFVTHSISESIQLSDRVVVMGPRPGRIERVVNIDLPRPRTISVRESPAFLAYQHEITEIFLARGVLQN
jgi:NitT/TauT family transport system ATP-binding protein